MTDPAKTPVDFIGCDVGKAAIVVFDSRDTRTQSIPNQPDALAVLAKSLDPDCFVVCEATGGHEAALLRRHGLGLYSRPSGRCPQDAVVRTHFRKCSFFAEHTRSELMTGG